MNHTITIGGMLASIGLVLGAVLICFAVLQLLAAMMSDTSDVGGAGCLWAGGLGLVLTIGCLVALFA